MIPTRDGVKLHTLIFTPKDRNGPLPILFDRTPYGVLGNEQSFASSFEYLIDDGYVIVFQDIRGRFQSEGEFVMQRSPHAPGDRNGIDETTDAYDSIDWLVKNVPGNNGRVGMLGVSYPGWLVTMALLDPHPALKAASEQATPADMFLGDDFHHNGAFRLSYGFEYAALLESSKTANTDFGFDRADTYRWYADLGVLSNANEKYFHGKMPTWNDFTAHPNYDEFWQKQAFPRYIKGAPKVPNLNVAGWWDQEDFYGPVKVYELFEKSDQQHLNIWWWVRGTTVDGARRMAASSAQSRSIATPASIIASRLRRPGSRIGCTERGRAISPRRPSSRQAATAGRSTIRGRRNRPSPPRSTCARVASCRSMRLLPRKAKASIPTCPIRRIPCRTGGGPISPTYPGGRWPTWLVEDQRFVDDRPDVLTFQTEPLKDDLKIAGDIVARIFASTSGSDSDWVVKLIDVYPESYPSDPELAGYELMIADEILRGRFRDELRTSHGDYARCGDAVHHRSAHQRSRVSERASRDGSDSEHLVSAVRR